MFTKLVNIEKLSGPRGSVYSYYNRDAAGKKEGAFAKFCELNGGYNDQVLNILQGLRSMSNKTGFTDNFFRLCEGKPGDLICAFNDDPDAYLRVYCIKISEEILILGNGGPKTTRTWNEDERLSQAVNELMKISAIVRNKLSKSELRISEDYLRLEGDFILMSN